MSLVSKSSTCGQIFDVQHHGDKNDTRDNCTKKKDFSPFNWLRNFLLNNQEFNLLIPQPRFKCINETKKVHKSVSSENIDCSIFQNRFEAVLRETKLCSIAQNFCFWPWFLVFFCVSY